MEIESYGCAMGEWRHFFRTYCYLTDFLHPKLFMLVEMSVHPGRRMYHPFLGHDNISKAHFYVLHMAFFWRSLSQIFNTSFVYKYGTVLHALLYMSFYSFAHVDLIGIMVWPRKGIIGIVLLFSLSSHVFIQCSPRSFIKTLKKQKLDGDSYPFLKQSNHFLTSCNWKLI